MADADVNVRMTAQTADAQQAWLSVITALNNVEAALKRIESTGKRGGKSVAKDMDDMATNANRFASAVASVVGIGGPLAAMLTLTQTIRAEVEAVIQAGQQSAEFGVQRAQMFARASVALGTGRETTGGGIFTEQDMDREVRRLSRERRISQIALLQALETGFAAGGELKADEIVEAVSRTGEVFPQLALPEAGEDLANVSGAILEIMKAERFAGRPVSADQSIAAFMKLFNQSRAQTIQEFAGPFVSALSQAAILTEGKDTLGDIGSLVATVQQAAVDPSGRRTATNLITAMERFQEAIIEETPQLRDMGLIERMNYLAESKAPEAQRARVRLLGVFAPGVTDEEARAIENKTGTSLGEKRTEAILRALITEGSRVRELYSLIRSRVGDPTSKETVEESFETLAKMQEQTRILQQRRDKVVAEESALSAAEREGRIQEFTEASAASVFQAEVGVTAFPGFREGLRKAGRYAGRMLGFDETRIQRTELEMMRESLQGLRRKAEATDDPVIKSEIEGRAEALDANLRALEKTYLGALAGEIRDRGETAPEESALLDLVGRQLGTSGSRLRVGFLSALDRAEPGQRLEAAGRFLETQREAAIQPEQIEKLNAAIETFQANANGIAAFTPPGEAMDAINNNTEALNRVADALERGPRDRQVPVPVSPPLRPQQ